METLKKMKKIKKMSDDDNDEKKGDVDRKKIRKMRKSAVDMDKGIILKVTNSD